MKTIKTDIRATPWWLFSWLDGFFRFDLDVCAIEENAKVKKFITPEMDGLKKDWGKCNWMNPPYSSGNISKWLEKATCEQSKGNTTVALIPGDTSTKWYREYINRNPDVIVWDIPCRVKFIGDSSAKFCNKIAIFMGWKKETK